ncbi:DUF2231 domain-containing protein [Saccharothrix yanglingensis]|uniref:DUF2231 domain-containing protein n=1 Tax=Saccharothrix yanglingensis TaxID=659496 RepID=UPI0027D1FB9B|nr:DUF2231 domain-containing protein [Saccharothrix yanglingensis]
MRRRVRTARTARHAVPPNLTAFPFGLLTTAVGFDVLHLLTGRADFAVTAAHLIAAGVLLGSVTAAGRWLAWLLAPDALGDRVRRISLLYRTTNTVVLLLFGTSWLLRQGYQDWLPTWSALGAAWAGLLTAGFGGWLAGELAERLSPGGEHRAVVGTGGTAGPATAP